MAMGNVSLGLVELSAIREMANAGLAHATKSLSEFTGHKFNVDVPYAQSVALTRIPMLLGDGEQIYVGIYLPVKGEVEGHIAFLLPWESAQLLWKMVMGRAPRTPAEVDEDAASAMLEVGNIFNGSFLEAISDIAKFGFSTTQPVLAIDSCSVILAAIVSEASQGDADSMAIDTEFFDDEHTTSGIFLFLPTVSGLRSLFSALGISKAA